MHREDSRGGGTPGKPPDERREWCVTVPNSLLDETKAVLSDRAMVVLMFVESYARSDGLCLACNATLARRSNRSLRSLQEALAELQDHGYVAREKSDAGKPVIRVLRRISLMAEPKTYEDEITPRGCGNPHGGGADFRTHNKNDLNKNGDGSGGEKDGRRRAGRCEAIDRVMISLIPHDNPPGGSLDPWGT